ncbi:hypothetical protein INT45_004050 [Circinella minor]|uniref:SET domain-containing protein n=1 Tax=Circinella minor TaxID=1195481 RepID=A0A8H7VJ69_9FUNG|nr:hypothetical protein INT45_004050 [Circinella minor]
MVVPTILTEETARDFLSVHGHPFPLHEQRHSNRQQGEKWLEVCSLPGKGRGFVATQRIPAGATVHTSEPLAAVVSQEWIPETCAWCFHFTYPKRMRYKIDTTIPKNLNNINNTNKKKKKQQHTYTTVTIKDVLFCSEPCRHKFQTYGHVKNESELLLRCYYALEQEYNLRQKQNQDDDNNDIDSNGLITDLQQELDQLDINSDEQLSKWIDQAWITFTQQGLVKAQQWIPDDAEQTMMRLVACCVTRRQIESEYLFADQLMVIPKFNDLLNVQCNELAYIRRTIIDNNNNENKRIIPDELIQVMEMFKFFVSATSSFLNCPHIVFRAVYFREMANSFGLWEMSPQQHQNNNDGNVTDDLELLGWGIYPSAVYFNHACNANVRKIRDGRKMVFIAKRDIEEGEEACISYGCVEDTVEERRKRLLEHYHFLCACNRCEQESA